MTEAVMLKIIKDRLEAQIEATRRVVLTAPSSYGKGMLMGLELAIGIVDKTREDKDEIENQ